MPEKKARSLSLIASKCSGLLQKLHSPEECGFSSSPTCFHVASRLSVRAKRQKMKRNTHPRGMTMSTQTLTIIFLTVKKGVFSAACERKGRRFDFQSGHMPGLRARSPASRVREATDVSHTHMFFSLFFSFPVSNSKYNLLKKSRNPHVHPLAGTGAKEDCLALRGEEAWVPLQPGQRGQPQRAPQ